MAIDNSGLEGMEQTGPEDEGMDAPILEPKSSDRVLEAIEDAERVFDPYQRKCDRIDKLYSSLQSLSGLGLEMDGRFLDREYNLFWASVEVIKPSIYSRPPVPVVTPKFKDRDPVVRITAELLERDVTSGLDRSDINQVMLNVRDDLVINARGVIWETYESAEADDEPELVCIEHLERRDFLHEPARKWADVGWVARGAWLSKREARKRFFKTSGNAYQDADYSKRRDDHNNDNPQSKTLKAKFWEVWSKTEKKCYWVSKGVPVFLDEDKPHLKLQGKFPCPRPAYGTLQRGTLIPVPDISYIEDQLESINELTSRIHGLVGKLQVKGLYPAGGDIGDAVEMALKMDGDEILVPVNAASMLNGGAGSLIEWIPIEQIANTIIAAIEARRELIGNVQELFGIADIMRGETDARETKGAQVLKAQYGAVRIRDRVMELVRIARDTVHIMAEIMAEEFDFDTLLDMAQMELPTESEIKKQMEALRDQAKKELTALADKAEQAIMTQREQPEAQPVNPQEAEAQFKQAQQQIIQKYQPQIQKLSMAVTEEAVRKLLRDNKTRSFVFDIETDSTIYPDEQAEKEARNEFMTAFVTATQSLAALAMSGPAGAKMAGGLIKFQLGPYRAGRELEGLVDEWVESLESMPQQPNPEAMKAQAEQEYKNGLLALEGKKCDAEIGFKARELELRAKELQLKEAEIAQKPQVEAAKAQIKGHGDAQAKQFEVEGSIATNQAELEADATTTQMEFDAEAQLEAQRSSDSMAQKMIDDAFKRDELAVKTNLAYDQLAVSEANAARAAEAKAKQPKGKPNV